MDRRPRAKRTLAALVLVTAAVARAASAAELEDSEPAPASVDRQDWNDAWPRFHPVEGIIGFASIATSAVFLLIVSPPERPNLQGGVLFDSAARDLLRAQSSSTRNTAALASDVLYYAMAAYPLLDVAIAVWLVSDRDDLAVQLALIDLQSMTLALASAIGSEKLVGRERPSGPDCRADSRYSRDCDANLNVSFFSGHTAAATMTASLICAQHARFDIYGGGWPDAVACAGSIATAVVIGALRVVSDKHWSTDVVTGAAVGLLWGYVIPHALHFGFDSGDPTAMILPILGPNATGLALAGRF